MFRIAKLVLLALVATSQAVKLTESAEVEVEEDAEEEAFAQVDTLQMARLMSKESADEDEERNLTTAQQHKIDTAAKAAFKSMDANGDGKISYKEALNVFLKSLYK